MFTLSIATANQTFQQQVQCRTKRDTTRYDAREAVESWVFNQSIKQSANWVYVFKFKWRQLFFALKSVIPFFCKMKSILICSLLLLFFLIYTLDAEGRQIDFPRHRPWCMTDFSCCLILSKVPPPLNLQHTGIDSETMASAWQTTNSSATMAQKFHWPTSVTAISIAGTSPMRRTVPPLIFLASTTMMMTMSCSI